MKKHRIIRLEISENWKDWRRQELERILVGGDIHPL